MFHLLQDNDWQKKIFPAFPKSWKGMPSIGPHFGGEGLLWMIDGRDNKLKEQVPEMKCDLCKPGDKFRITFYWPLGGACKQLIWDKLEDGSTTAGDSPSSSLVSTPRELRGKYYIAGSWSCFNFQEMQPDPRKDGLYSTEVHMTSLGASFQIVRDEDWDQAMYPEVPEDEKGTIGSKVLGPDDGYGGKLWVIEGEVGDLFQVDFFRNPQHYEDMKVQWQKIGKKEVDEPEPRYFYAGDSNRWGLRDEDPPGYFTEMKKSATEAGVYTVEIECEHDTEEFQIVQNKLWTKCIHPDSKETTKDSKHEVMGPDDQGQDLNWIIGKSGDRYRRYDIFEVKLETKSGENKDQLKVSWQRLRAGNPPKLYGLKGLFQRK